MEPTLGQFVRQARKERRLGLRIAARQMGVTATYLSGIERDDAEKYPPGEEIIRKLADILGADFEDLMRLAARAANEAKDVRKDLPVPDFICVARGKGISG